MRLPLLATLLALIATPSFAQSGANDIDLDALAKQPGFTVTKKVENGEEIVEARKASVTLRKASKGVTGSDSKSAVLCAWQIYVAVKLAADVCFPDSHAELRQDLTDAVGRIKRFIVANSLTPVTDADLDAYVQHEAQQAAKRPRSASVTELCSGSLKELEDEGHAKRRSEVDDLLAEPRPPVMNPCL